ncbi:MAG TPA: polysaccharide deacetylase family protein [Ktedonobacterales bacterium]|nr:polysaccharide deacetylase family protein [Ktedonobacterales bacterium]
MATRGVIMLLAVALVVSVAASLVESGGQTFSPVNGITMLQQPPLQPEGFGDTATVPTGPTSPASGSIAAISGETHKPTPSPTATHTSGSSTAAGTYPASYTGSWSGGAGQGCPSGGAPRPRTNVITSASSYGRGPTNMVALTFDDGPTPFSSPPILSYLEQTHTPATFFVLGQYAHAYPWLVQREAADGFAIGVHTWNHPDMRLLSPSARANQWGSTIQQLHADLGPNVCIWLWRPPYGSVDSGIVAQAGAFGLTTVNWNVDPADWSRPGTMVIVQRVLSQVRPGSIILMHDGPAAREQTAAALPYILAGLHARGLVPVTLPTLLGSDSAPVGPAPATPPSPTATATATATVSATATPTATATATPAPTATATPTPTATATGATGSTGFGGSLGVSVGDAVPIALSLWLWENTIPGYSGA